MIKRFFSFSLALFSFGSWAYSQATTVTQTDPNAPVFLWDEEMHDFGKIPQGVPVTVKYYFTNDGKSDLIIDMVKSTCGCVTPDWTRGPIAPGKRGYAGATYNAAAPGNFHKAIYVFSNASSTPIYLYFIGEVVKNPDATNFYHTNNPTAPVATDNDSHDH